MQAAIYSGIFGSIAALPVQYPTNDCVWEPFTTLGVCSSCEDMSAQAKRSCTPMTDPQHAVYGDVFSCYYSMDDDMWWNKWNLSVNKGVWFDGSWYNTLINSTGLPPADYGTGPSSLARLISVAALRLPSPSNATSVREGQTMLQNAEVSVCRIHMCERSMGQTTYANASLTMPLISTIALNYTAPYPVWQDGIPHVGPLSASDPSDIAKLNGSSYTYNNIAVSDLDMLLGNWLYGEYYSSVVYTDGGGGMNDLQAAPALANSVDGTLTSLAESMSHAVQAQGFGSTLLSLQAYQNDVYVHVEWAWLTLLFVVVVLSCVLLAVTMFESRWQRSITWKSSTMPLLFHGLHVPHGMSASRVDRNAMERAAKQLRVQLRL